MELIARTDICWPVNIRALHMGICVIAAATTKNDSANNPLKFTVKPAKGQFSLDAIRYGCKWFVTEHTSNSSNSNNNFASNSFITVGDGSKNTIAEWHIHIEMGRALFVSKMVTISDSKPNKCRLKFMICIRSNCVSVSVINSRIEPHKTHTVAQHLPHLSLDFDILILLDLVSNSHWNENG